MHAVGAAVAQRAGDIARARHHAREVADMEDRGEMSMDRERGSEETHVLFLFFIYFCVLPIFLSLIHFFYSRSTCTKYRYLFLCV